MRIAGFSLQGFRAFRDLTHVDFGPLATIVGRNDSGKSSLLHALDVFFNRQPEDSDFSRDLPDDGNMVLHISFADLPSEIEIEEGVRTDLASENLTGGDDRFTVKRVYDRRNPKKPRTTYMVRDFVDEKFANLCSKKEKDLNVLATSIGLEVKKSGSGITNKDKRQAIRNLAIKNGVALALVEIAPAEAALNVLGAMPEFSMFSADESLSEEDTAFQKEFKTLVEMAISKIAGRAEIEKGVESELDKEFSRIHGFLKGHTDEVTAIKARPTFRWKDLISFYLECTDAQGKEIAFSKRGSGLRRLLMVAYFQYLSQRGQEIPDSKRQIYAIEEPETYLHPGAQRALLDSLNGIARHEQVLLSSHSPVFAGSTEVESLVLVTRQAGVATATQGHGLDLRRVAAELGVEPADRIYGYKAVVFLEGDEDCKFFGRLSVLFKEKGLLAASFEDKGIGLVPSGGDNLKGLICRKAMGAMSRRFAVVLDSDRKGADAALHVAKARLKAGVEADGGACFILRKREIENYLHPSVISAATGKVYQGKDFDFADVKGIFGAGISGLVNRMTVEEVLERDHYLDAGSERHELLDICDQILKLTT